MVISGSGVVSTGDGLYSGVSMGMRPSGVCSKGLAGAYCVRGGVEEAFQKITARVRVYTRSTAMAMAALASTGKSFVRTATVRTAPAPSKSVSIALSSSAARAALSCRESSFSKMSS